VSWLLHVGPVLLPVGPPQAWTTDRSSVKAHGMMEKGRNSSVGPRGLLFASSLQLPPVDVSY
jgi:hypothetical protein